MMIVLIPSLKGWDGSQGVMIVLTLGSQGVMIVLTLGSIGDGCCLKGVFTGDRGY